MDAEAARDIINKNELIPRKSSKIILKRLSCDEDIPVEILQKYKISYQYIEDLRVKVANKLKNIDHNIKKPRNLIFYQIIKDKYPNFDWHVGDIVSFKAPRVGTILPSLSSLLMDRIDKNSGASELHKRYDDINQLPSVFVHRLSDLFKELNIVFPDKFNMSNLVILLSKALKGDSINIVCPVCPDYSYEIIEGDSNKYKYTFEKVGSSIGVVAKHAINMVEKINLFFKKNNINAKFTFISGDFEALSGNNCKKIGITQQDFIHNVSISASKIDAYFSEDNISSLTFSDFIDLDTDWLALCRNQKKMIVSYWKDRQEDIDKILESRLPMYSTWFPNVTSNTEYRDVLFSQGSEYAAMGQIINDNFKNVFIFGTDHHVMGEFYKASSNIPVIYTKRIYQ